MFDGLEDAFEQELGGKILEEIEYSGGVPSVQEKAMKCALGDDPSVNEGRIVEKKKKMKEMDFSGVRFFDNFFNENNIKIYYARIKIISPDNFAIIAFSDPHKLRKDYGETTFERYQTIFRGDEWGESLKDYILFLYGMGVAQVSFCQADTKTISALLKYIKCSFDVRCMGETQFMKKDDDGRHIVGFQDTYKHILYWDEVEMPAEFRMGLLTRAVDEFGEVFDEASNVPEGDDIFRYFYDNPLPGKNFKVLRFTGEQITNYEDL